MLDAFEIRLADMTADALAGVTEVQLVSRPRTDLASIQPPADRALVVVQILNAAPGPRLGDDAREREGQRGNYRLRTVLSLAGQAALQFQIAAAASGASDLAERRALLFRVLDRILVAYHNDDVRSGRAFRTDVDQGFELDGFRLARIEGFPEDDGPPDPIALRALYDFAGRFWPVEVPLEGRIITTLPSRIAVLPVQLPEQIRTRIGGPDLEIPLRLDLRSLEGAPSMLAARLLGAAPPGALVGDTVGAPPGWTGFTPDADGVTWVRYRPPGGGSGAARVRVATVLAQASGPTIPIVEFLIELNA